MTKTKIKRVLSILCIILLTSCSFSINSSDETKEELKKPELEEWELFSEDMVIAQYNIENELRIIPIQYVGLIDALEQEADFYLLVSNPLCYFCYLSLNKINDWAIENNEKIYYIDSMLLGNYKDLEGYHTFLLDSDEVRTPGLYVIRKGEVESIFEGVSSIEEYLDIKIH